MIDTAYAGRHRTASAVDLTIPPTIHANSISTVADEGDLVVALRDDDTGNPAVIRFGPAAIAALRDALGSGPAVKAACICGTGRSVQCASPRHAVTA
jgi:hypothetical protein